MKKKNETLKSIEYWFLGLSMLLITVILCTNVILRHIFSSSLSWAEEAARYLMIWITFIGASVCVYKGGNISIDSIVNYLSNKGKKKLSIITTIISMIFLAIFTYLSADLTIQVARNKQYTAALNIPMLYIYLAMPVGAMLTLIRYLQQLWNLFKDTKGRE